jgi:hypothetical protein
MKKHEQDELLKELLGGEEVSDFRQASLQGGLVEIRRRRARKLAVRTAAMLLLPLIAVLAVLIHRRSEPPTKQIASVKLAAMAHAATKANTAGVKIISDEELFALFPGRSMALVGKPGEQTLVFLDGGSAETQVR